MFPVPPSPLQGGLRGGTGKNNEYINEITKQYLINLNYEIVLFEENKSKKLKLKKNITKNLTHQNFYPNRSVEAVIIKDELDNTTLKNNKSIFGKHKNCFKEC